MGSEAASQIEREMELLLGNEDVEVQELIPTESMQKDTKQDEKKKRDNKRKVIQSTIEKRRDGDQSLLLPTDSIEEDTIDIATENEASGPSVKKRRKIEKDLTKASSIPEKRGEAKKGSKEKKSSTTSSSKSTNIAKKSEEG